MDKQIWNLYNELCIIFGVLHTRGLVFQEKGIRFYIYAKESGHNKPHLHIEYDGKKLALEIPSGEVLNNNYKMNSHQLLTAQKILIKNKYFFIKEWNRITTTGIYL